MTWVKMLADGLTAARLLISMVLVTWGLAVGPDGLAVAAMLVLLAWTTDALDGPLARMSGLVGTSWIGRHDLAIDVALAVALLFWMCCGDLIFPVVATIYLGLWAFVLSRYGRLTKPVGAAFQGPIYGWFVVCLLLRGLVLGRLMTLWVLANVGLTWRRLIGTELPQFLDGMWGVARVLWPRAPHPSDELR